MEAPAHHDAKPEALPGPVADPKNLLRVTPTMATSNRKHMEKCRGNIWKNIEKYWGKIWKNGVAINGWTCTSIDK